MADLDELMAAQRRRAALEQQKQLRSGQVEALAARDPANAGAQVGLAVSLSKLGAASVMPANKRRQHLRAGLRILESLAASGRLMPNQDHRDWFRQRIDQVV